MTTTEWNTWFGPAASPLFGTLHGPDNSRAKGGVVLCPPLGKEHIDTFRGMRLLAQSLAAQGFLVLRFDYFGTGDSSGSLQDPLMVESWLESIRSATDFLRGTGLRSVALAGLRAGALLAGAAAERCGPLSALVLWDPILAGRSYLREQTAFYKLSLGENAPGIDTVSIIGAEFTPETADALSALTLKSSLTKLPESMPRLIAAREDKLGEKGLSGLISQMDADVVSTVDHEAFVSPASFLVRIPGPSIAGISEWVNAAVTDQREPFRVDQCLSTTMRNAQGTAITETIERLGEKSLFAIRTEIALPGAAIDAAVVLNSTANEHRIGAGRMWVSLARTLPQYGVAVLRYDRRGTGDTGHVTPDEHTAIYSADSEEDLLTAAKSGGASPANLVLGGLCSGAWNSARAALLINARAVILVNNIVWSTRRRKSFEGQIDPAVLDQVGTNSDGDPGWRYKVKDVLRAHLPYIGWRALGVRGVTQVPEVLLRALARRNVNTTVILSPPDHDWFVSQRGIEGLDRLTRANWTGTLSVAERGDHSAYHRDMRTHVLRGMVDSIVREFDAHPVTSTSDPS